MELQITFHQLAPSPFLEEAIRLRALKLERFGQFTSCRVLVEAGPHRNTYHVKIELAVPGGEIVVSHEPGEHEDPYATVREVFEKARRQLDDRERRAAM